MATARPKSPRDIAAKRDKAFSLGFLRVHHRRYRSRPPKVNPRIVCMMYQSAHHWKSRATRSDSLPLAAELLVWVDPLSGLPNNVKLKRSSARPFGVCFAGRGSSAPIQYIRPGAQVSFLVVHIIARPQPYVSRPFSRRGKWPSQRRCDPPASDRSPHKTFMARCWPPSRHGKALFVV